MSSQGASNNAGQAVGKSFVSFSRGAAQRIAKVVRTVEAGDRSQPAVSFDHPLPGGGVVLKVGTAPSGAVVTSAGIFTDGTTMKKIIADGTVSDVQT